MIVESKHPGVRDLLPRSVEEQDCVKQICALHRLRQTRCRKQERCCKVARSTEQTLVRGWPP